VLDALEQIHRRDRALMFQHSCHHGSCGRCACIINGRERLACLTVVLELGAQSVTVEPLRNSIPIGDLADWPQKLFAGLEPQWSSKRRSEWNSDAVPPGELDGYTRFENCIECGACVSACPVTRDFSGPAVLAALNRERYNRPQSSAELLRLASADNGVSRCERALECSRVCPAGVYPARHISELRQSD
jgi:succinate dehydrogenase / fumarate reductase iron-sulfur subunit